MDGHETSNERDKECKKCGILIPKVIEQRETGAYHGDKEVRNPDNLKSARQSTEREE